MFEDLLISKHTAANLERYLRHPSHALLIVGGSGSGKSTLAKVIASGLLNINPASLDSFAFFTMIQKPEGKKDIPIESVRQITKALSLRVPGQAEIKRVIFIEDAHLMNTEAQNAFLKSLEEPAAGTVFIMSTISKSTLLPTVTSRMESINVQPVTVGEALKFYDSIPAEDVTAAWNLSQGAPSLLNSLLKDEDNRLKKAVNEAKTIVQSTKYDRLLILDGLTKDKDQLMLTLEGMSRVFKALYRAAAAKNDSARLRSISTATRLVIEAQKDLELNVLPRLVVLNLVLSLSV